jgi:hypothetical protein
MASDSFFDRPTMEVVNSGCTYKAFQPVTGCVLKKRGRDEEEKTFFFLSILLYLITGWILST